MDKILEQKALLRDMVKTWGSGRAAAEALSVPYSTMSSWLYDKGREVPPWVFSALRDKATIAGLQITITELTEKLEASEGRNVVAADLLNKRANMIHSVFPYLEDIIKSATDAIEEDESMMGTYDAGSVPARESLTLVEAAWEQWKKDGIAGIVSRETSEKKS